MDTIATLLVARICSATARDRMPHSGGSFGKASVTFKLSPTKRRVTITLSVAFDQSCIPASDYRQWRRWLQGIDRLLQRGVRLVPRTQGR